MLLVKLLITGITSLVVSVNMSVHLLTLFTFLTSVGDLLGIDKIQLKAIFI